MLIQSFGAYVGIYYEGIVLAVLIFLLLNLYRIYRVTKINMTRDLLFGFSFMAIGIFFSWLAKWYLWQYSEESLEWGYFVQLVYKFKLSLTCAIIGHYFISMFFQTIFSPSGTRPPRKNKIIIRKATEIIIILLSHIPAAITRDNNLALMTDTLAFGIMMVDALFLIPAIHKSHVQSKQKKFGKKFKYFTLMAALDLNFLIMLFIDRITMVLMIPGSFGGLGYTLFYFIAWLSLVFCLVFSMYGFVRK